MIVWFTTFLVGEVHGWVTQARQQLSHLCRAQVVVINPVKDSRSSRQSYDLVPLNGSERSQRKIQFGLFAPRQEVVNAEAYQSLFDLDKECLNLAAMRFQPH